MEESSPEEPTRKPLHFVSSSLKDLRGFPEKVKDKVGDVLDDVQWGRVRSQIRVLRGFGSAMIREVVVDDSSGTYRAVFTVEFPKAIYVLHSFQKKSKTGIATTKEDVRLIQDRREDAKEHYDANYQATH